jgi:hypothetical protein
MSAAIPANFAANFILSSSYLEIRYLYHSYLGLSISFPAKNLSSRLREFFEYDHPPSNQFDLDKYTFAIKKRFVDAKIFFPGSGNREILSFPKEGYDIIQENMRRRVI